MAFKLAELFVDISVKSGALVKGMSNAKQQINAMGSSLAWIGGLVAAVSGAAVGMGVKFVKMAAAQEKADNDLANALELSGQERAKNTARLTAYAGELQKTTVYQDDAIVAAMSFGTTLGIQADKMHGAIQGAIGLSKVYGIDLNQAMRAQALALKGNFIMLSRYIPALRATNSASQKKKILLDAMNKGFRMAQGEIGTTAGKMALYSNRLGEVGEAIGFSIIKNGEFSRSIEKVLSTMEKAFGPDAVGTKAVVSLTQGFSALSEYATTFVTKLEAIRDLFPFFTSVVRLMDTPRRALTGAMAAGLEAGFSTGAAGPSVRNRQGQTLGFASQDALLAELKRNTAVSKQFSPVK